LRGKVNLWTFFLKGHENIDRKDESRRDAGPKAIGDHKGKKGTRTDQVLHGGCTGVRPPDSKHHRGRGERGRPADLAGMSPESVHYTIRKRRPSTGGETARHKKKEKVLAH